MYLVQEGLTLHEAFWVRGEEELKSMAGVGLIAMGPDMIVSCRWREQRMAELQLLPGHFSAIGAAFPDSVTFKYFGLQFPAFLISKGLMGVVIEKIWRPPGWGDMH